MNLATAIGLTLVVGSSALSAQGQGPVRDHHEMVFDVAGGRLLLFGGNSRDAENQYTYVADTWTLGNTGWTRIASDGPSPRSSFSMAYDAARERTVVFGGYFEGAAYDDTWIFDGAKWRKADGSGPASRISPALCFDPQSKLLLLFGGLGESLYSDTWAWDGESWSRKAEKGPPGRNRMAVFHHPARKSVIVHGGYIRVDGRGQGSDDMWEWRDDRWSEVEQGSVKPPPLRSHRAVHDERRKVVVLFGGSTEHGRYRDETWEWDGTDWTKRTTDPRPPARGNFAMAYDGKLERVVIHGGKDSDGQTLSDSWSWDGTEWRPLKTSGREARPSRRSSDD